MTVTNVEKDIENLTLTLTTDLEAGADRVWQMWENPRLLEKWWGPPTYPATFVEHDFKADGVVKYFMTGPEGEKHGGVWNMIAVESPGTIEFEDAFADENGDPSPGMPTTRVRVEITEAGQPAGTTRMTIASTFPSAEAMKELTEMGVEEGLRQAVGQIDDLL